VCLRAKIAQSVEHSTENAGVGGSIPPLGILFLQIPKRKPEENSVLNLAF
jgi:hypothetical protein